MAEQKTAADIFASNVGGENESLSDHVGKVIEVVSAEFDDKGQYEAVIFEAVVGEDVLSFWSSSKAVVEKLKQAVEYEVLPATVQITSGPGAYGKPWYDLEPPA